MTAGTQIIVLGGFVLPEEVALRRDHIRKPERRTEHYLANYDRRTLFYDCVYQADRGQFQMIAPPLFNLWDPMQVGLRLDGVPVRKIRRRRFDKYCVLSVASSPGALSLEIEGVECAIAMRKDISTAFAGLNCVATLNKDNPLDWIHDWAGWHVRVHGLQAVVIFDNASTTYTPEALAETLASIKGLEQVAIVSAPFPYGTTDRVERGELRPNFLQPAMLNLARTDILRHARAVLNADIDELVLSRNGTSVFDAAAARPNRAVRLPVRWAYPAPEQVGQPTPQRAHVYRSSAKVVSSRKWCAVPSGALSQFGGWYVHHVGGEVFKLISEDWSHEVVHCRAASTGWNTRKSRHVEMDDLSEDPELVAAFAGLGREGEAA